MPNVLVIGDANVDIIVPYPVFLNAERTQVKYPEPHMQGGGTAANTATALARLGVKSSFIGTVGDDQYGKMAREELAAVGVDISGLIVDPTLNTVGVFAFVDEFGERYLWGWPREHQSFKYLDLAQISMEQVRQADWIHASGMAMTFPASARDTMVRIFKEAHEAGVPTSLDLNSRCDDRELDPEFKDVLLEIISYTTHLLGSGPDELEYLGEGGWRHVAESFATDDRIVVARNGDQGSIAFTKGTELHAPAFEVEVIDTIGAGDTYNAGFISSLLEGESLEDALRRGNAVSGFTVSRRGSQNSPSSPQLHDFTASHNTKRQ